MKYDTLYIIFDNELSEYKDKLEYFLEKKFEIMSCQLDEYDNTKSIPEEFAVAANFIFLGNASRQACAPEIKTWQYSRFGCRIGWTQNKCAIFAQSRDLAFDDYKEFNKYCKLMNIDYQDVIIPSETFFSECKNLFSAKTGNIHHAQYSSLIYEFVNKYLENFIHDESRNNLSEELNDELNKIKKIASEKMTLKQKIYCHATIHAASIANSVVGFIPIPVADAIPITASQISMILALGNIFDNKLTKSDAQIILKAVAAPLTGRALVKGGLTLFPGVGWAINGVIAGAITEILGWTIANDFATKMKNKDTYV